MKVLTEREIKSVERGKGPANQAVGNTSPKSVYRCRSTDRQPIACIPPRHEVVVYEYQADLGSAPSMFA